MCTVGRGMMPCINSKKIPSRAFSGVNLWPNLGAAVFGRMEELPVEYHGLLCSANNVA